MLGLHCALARGQRLAPLMACLGVEAALPDLPGHGTCPWDRSTPYLSACRAVVDQAHPAPGPVFGHSFGGALALDLALRAPQRVTALTLFEPVAFCYAQATDAPEVPAFERQNTTMGTHIQQGNWEEALDAFLGLWGDGTPLPPPIRARLAPQMELIAAQSDLILQDAHPNSLRLADLAQLTCPLVVLRGTNSPPITAAIHRAILAHCPQAIEHVLVDRAHMAPVTHPDQVAALMTRAPSSLP